MAAAETSLSSFFLLVMQAQLRKGRLRLEVKGNEEAMGKWGEGYHFGRG